MKFTTEEISELIKGLNIEPDFSHRLVAIKAQEALLEKLNSGKFQPIFSEIFEPNENCRYDHVICDTPIGKFQIEWKSWSEYDNYYCVYLNDYFLDVSETLDDAEMLVQRHIDKVINLLIYNF